MPWERVGDRYINLPNGMWDDPEQVIAEVKHPRKTRRTTGLRVTQQQGFARYIEEHRPALIRMHRGATWRSQFLSGGQVGTLKKYKILEQAREIAPGRWVTELTPEAIKHLKLEGA